MNNLKRVLAMLLAMMMAFSMVACSKGGEEAADDKTANTQTE